MLKCSKCSRLESIRIAAGCGRPLRAVIGSGQSSMEARLARSMVGRRDPYATKVSGPEPRRQRAAVSKRARATADGVVDAGQAGSAWGVRQARLGEGRRATESGNDASVWRAVSGRGRYEGCLLRPDSVESADGWAGWLIDGWQAGGVEQE